MWVTAKAMFRVPSVTMNGGSRSPVTSEPLNAPKAAQTSSPMRIASSGCMPLSTASLVMTMLPNAITAPLDRSIPAVRMMSVWPIARVPTTITCCTTSDRLPPVRNRDDWAVKKTTASSSAMIGPRVERARAREASDGAGSAAAASTSFGGVTLAMGGTSSGRWEPGWRTLRTVGRAWPWSGPTYRASDWLSTPAVLGAEGGVLGLDALLRRVGDEGHAGVGVAGRLGVAAGEAHHRGDALLRHLQRVLLRGRRDLAVLDGLHARAAAVDRHDHDVLVLARGLEGVVGAEGGRLVDGVDQVDAGVLLQAVLHRGLALGLVAGGVLAADDLRAGGQLGGVLVDAGRAVAVEEAVMAQHADRDAGRQVEGGDLGRLAGLGGLCVLADEHAGLEVVGGEQRVGGVLRLGGGVLRDHQHAGVARLLDRGDDRLGVARGDQDPLDPGRDHVLDGGDLAGVVAVELAGGRQQLGALGLGLLLGALLHLDEERVGLGLGDEPHLDLAAARPAAVVPAGTAGRQQRQSHAGDGERHPPRPAGRREPISHLSLLARRSTT